MSSAFEKYKQATDTFAGVGGIDNLVVFKRGGDATFAGLKDAFRLEDGTIVRGKDFRKSEEYQSADGKQKRAYRAKLKAGAILTDKEMNLLLDTKGQLKPEVVGKSDDINETLEIAAKLADMEEKKDEFMQGQAEQSADFDRRADEPQAERRSSATDPGQDSSESGEPLSRGEIFATIDRELQEWKNELEAALTPPGPAIGV